MKKAAEAASSAPLKPTRKIDRSVEGAIAKMESIKQRLIVRTLTKYEKALKAVEDSRKAAEECIRILHKLGYNSPKE